MKSYAPAWPHGEIEKIFTDIYYVRGTNITVHERQSLQHSNNMIIVKNGIALTLINTVRLDEEGLRALDDLGQVTNIVRVGDFHGRHDAFYVDRYSAKLWALKGMKDEHDEAVDIVLTPNGPMPFPRCSLFIFNSATHPEGILHIDQEGGILITCDSIKNWTHPDQFFNEATANLYQKSGFFGTATLSNVWLEACHVQKSDFKALCSLPFKHLISAHGEPLLYEAHEKIEWSIKTVFNHE